MTAPPHARESAPDPVVRTLGDGIGVRPAGGGRQPRVAIYESTSLRRNSGGPPGYLWHLREGLTKSGDRSVRFITGEPGADAAPGLQAKLLKALKGLSDGAWRVVKSHGPTALRRETLALTSGAVLSSRLPGWAERDILSCEPDVLHCHKTIDVVAGHNSLEALGLRDRVRLVMTSHSPEMPAAEGLDSMVSFGLRTALKARVAEGLRAIDDRALAVADHFIFPCREALEPYETGWPGFSEEAIRHRTTYLETGICDPRDVGSLEAFPMPGGANTVCFVGRHNRVKGYDLLYQGAEPVMDAGRINVVVAGSPGPLPTPVHDRWTEFGWTDRASRLIAQSDAFVLPNRSTYFDIVALEVLALGRPLLASATGGNKVLGRRSGGVVLFEPSVEGLRDALEKAAGWDRSEIDRLGRENRTCYQDHFTEIAFANRYVAAMAAIPAARGAGL